MHGGRITRRGLLCASACATGMAAFVPAASAVVRRGRIDVHYHPIPPAWIDDPSVRTSMAPNVIGKAKAWSPAAALEEMDRNAISTAVCSIANPGVWFGDIAQGRRLARACNEYQARLASDQPGRFAFFAALPLPDITGSLAELAYACDTLHAQGVGLFTSYDQRWLADPAFAPVLEELSRRKVLLYVHPTAGSCCRRLIPNIPAALLEYPIDTSRTILQWIVNRQAVKYPGVRPVFSHDGGLLMAGIGRLHILAETQPDIGLPLDLAAQVSKLFYEISSSADAVTMSALRAYVPASQILLGTDSPFIGSMRPNLEQFERLRLTVGDRFAIERGNALRLIPSLA